jgi:hypothetical protein
MSQLVKALPIGLGALVLGAGLGYGLHALLQDPVEVIVSEPQIIKQELTEEELLAFCDDQVQPERLKAADAHQKVVDLQAALDAREAELAEMKKVDEKDAAKRAAAARRWKEMETEIESLQSELTTAKQERDQALVELKETVWKLDKQIKETEVQRQRAEKFKAESHENLWQAFEAEAKVEICDRGSRRRHEKCHEAVEAVLTPIIEERFMDCVDTFQSTPLLVQHEDKKATLPQFAVELGEDNRFTKNGWYIQFCDPTLPEAEGLDDF